MSRCTMFLERNSLDFHILSHNLAKYLNRGGLKSLGLIRRKTQGRTHALLTPYTINYNPTPL